MYLYFSKLFIIIIIISIRIAEVTRKSTKQKKN